MVTFNIGGLEIEVISLVIGVIIGYIVGHLMGRQSAMMCGM